MGAGMDGRAIPEPSSLVLFLVGGLPLAVRGRALVKRIGRKPTGYNAIDDIHVEP